MKQKTIFALGYFDGVHVGHGALLRTCRTLASEYNCRAGVVTFTGHPDALVLGKAPKLINSDADRQRLLTGLYRMDTVVTLPFDRQLMEMPWQDFVRMLICQHAGAGFICGSDFRFGKGGEGNAEALRDFCREAGLPCVVIPQQAINGIPISSTHIRSLLEQGDMVQAARFLGHPHILTGTVIPGQQLGRTMGIPTANLEVPKGILLPKPGVYACRTWVAGKNLIAVTNIGSRPTVGGRHITVEPHLLDFDGDLYGKELTLSFYSYLRPELKFDSLIALKAQIQRDEEQARKVLENC